ncbi:MAG: hypothetical protein IPP73_01110 [Chitinophagaceae bacterium]|nr:hypothetical protein [Chitinophagaceae bacterium]
MRQITVSLILLFSLLTQSAKAQDKLPPYPDVIRHFFSHYSYEPAEFTDALLMAKKKEGWYVTIVNQTENDRIKKQQLFWDLKTGQYLPLEGFNDRLSDEEAQTKIYDYLSGTSSVFNFYGYERCRYYGFTGWEMALIRDYGSNVTALSDTMLDGLARAYSFYATGFLWSQTGQLDGNNDPLRTQLDNMEQPSPERIMKFKNYVDTSLSFYKLLTGKNPAYKGVVGNAAMKMFNEQMHGYHMMMLAGDSLKANEYLNSITPDPIFLAMAKNYLAGLAPNAIIITYGDNDTYQLWYAQQALKYRKDVAVINNSLLGLAPAVNWIKSAKVVDFTIPASSYSKQFWQYARHYQTAAGSTSSQTVSEFLEELKNQKISQPDASTYEPLSYTHTKLTIPVDMAKLQKTGVPGKVIKNIQAELGEFMFLSDILTLDIINTNIYTRPIYFTTTFEPLAKYIQQEGFVYRLTTERGKEDTLTQTEVLLTEKALNTQIQLPALYQQGAAPHPLDFFDNTYISACQRVADYYFANAIPGKARAWSKKAFDYSTSHNAYVNFSIVKMADILFKTGENETAVKWLEKMAVQIEYNFNHPAALVLNLDKSMAASFVLMIQSTLKGNSNQSKIVDDVLQRLSTE